MLRVIFSCVGCQKKVTVELPDVTAEIRGGWWARDQGARPKKRSRILKCPLCGKDNKIEVSNHGP